MKRATLFAVFGIAFFVHWLVVTPSFEVSPTQAEWPYVLWFSAIILTLAFVVPQFAQLAGGSFAFRASLVVAAGAVLSSAANILEDGLKMDWAFFAFIAGLLIMYVGLIALTLSLWARGRIRHFALVPAGTMASLVFYVFAGGPLMLAAWLLAAALSLVPLHEQPEADAARRPESRSMT